MTTKRVDWGSIASVNFDDKRRKATGSKTWKEVIGKAVEDMEKAKDAVTKRQEIEPLLKNFLLDHMVNRKPIKVLAPISNPTEGLPGQNLDDDDDGFYNTSPSSSLEKSANARFEEMMETIPVGTELTYKSWDKTMGQWLFKGSNGKDYAIYDKNVILYKGNAIENPGFYGLLFSTSLVNMLD